MTALCTRLRSSLQLEERSSARASWRGHSRAANYREFAHEVAQTRQPYEEYLLALLEHEANQRDTNRRKRRVQEARFPLLRTLDEFDFRAIPSLKQTQVLELARCGYFERRENVALVGAIGTSKTHLAIALGLLPANRAGECAFTPPPG